MSPVIAWSASAGAWLLVAGPVYQAALELTDNSAERDFLARRIAEVAAPPE